MADVEPILASSGDGFFKKLPTIPVFSIHLSLSVTISFVGIALSVSWPEELHNKAYFIMTCLRVTFWLITFLFDHLVRKRHNDLRMNGYHDFHRTITMHNGVALNVVSAWNTILLLTQALLHHLEGSFVWNSWFTPISCMVALQVAETIILMATHGCYIAKVFKFNKNANAPDALMGTNTSSGSLGLMQPGGNVAELLEKQADLIAYLKDHNQTLNQKLHHMQLNTRVSPLGH
ncbi:transmembrane protein 192-like [Musca vetustissima]|uniref:transmembrane protein 192-like n=1 Tax=Musca vetustissima TaxID=27455 RepID=UPI002AB6631C|nr:transmembrane protein 192-like [Musca vetustissima]